MSSQNNQSNRIISVMVFLFVLLFAGILFMRYSPWATPESESVVSNSENTEIGEPTGDGHGSDLPSGPDDGVAVDDVEPPLINEADLPVLEMVLESGTVSILLRPDLAPNHVSRLIELSESGFYDGIVFHRVINGFMAQTGDPTGTGMGGSDLPDMEAEFSNRSFQRGILGMARGPDLDSANSQFFIVFDDASFLDGQYTVFGRVTEGMELIDGLRKGNPQDNGTVTNPDHIVSMRLKSNN